MPRVVCFQVPIRFLRSPVLRASRLGIGLLCAGVAGAIAATAADARGVLIQPRQDPGPARTGFSIRTPSDTGIQFTNHLSLSRSLTNQILLNGSGVAAGDVNGDGWCDLYFCGLDAPNALYLNRGGWRFELAPKATEVACPDQASTGAALADIDGDGDLDLLVHAIDRGPRVFLNDSTGRFTDVTERSGLGPAAGGMSFALADVDGNGSLDLYAVNYRRTTMRDEPEKRFRVGVTNGVYQLQAVDQQPATAPGVAHRYSVDPVAGVLENGEADVLYLNDGQGRFRPVEWGSGFRTETGAPAPPPYDWGLSALFHDLNHDGAPDLYVCNDFQSPDRIWINDGHGRFQAVARAAVRQTSLFSMGVDVADVDRDGGDDLFVVDMLSREHGRRQVQVMELAPVTASDPGANDRPQTSRNTLLRSRKDGTYAELAHLAGVEASEWSWCPVFLDVDLDGFEDLLITTGHERDAQNADVAATLEEARRRQPMSFPDQLRMRSQFPRLDVPNVAFRNRGEFRFEDQSAAWGFDSRRISHGMALADLDGDGDLDVVINCLNDGPLIYENTGTAPRVAIRLKGLAPNTRGIGSRVCVTFPGLPVQCQEIMAGGRYLSSDDASRTFAAGSSGSPGRVEVRWRSGRRSTVAAVKAGEWLEIDEAAAEEAPRAGASPSPTSSPGVPWFSDRSSLLKHRHTDPPEDDFARQRLLPYTLSDPGPPIAWFDFNGDGWDDLLVGTGRGGSPVVFRNDTRGGFIPQRATNLLKPVDRDLTAILGWRPRPDRVGLLFGFFNPEGDRAPHPTLRQVDLTSGAIDDALSVGPFGSGAMVLGDLEGDGRLDLFVGGQAGLGQFPEAGNSRLFRLSMGRWESHPAAGPSALALGNVRGAVLSDLDEDGRAELVVATDWGPLRILRFGSGSAEAWDPPVTFEFGSAAAGVTQPLSHWTGGWNSVTTGDFDGDGRPDLVAGNWGRNTRFQRFAEHPILMFYGDADGDGGQELIETRFDPGEGRYVPARDWRRLSESIPTLRDAFQSFGAFARAGWDDIPNDSLPPLRQVSLRILESCLFLNRGDHFVARPLPFEAQVSPVFGVAVGDFDGDGAEDLVVTQNRFGMAPGDSRLDAGRGVVLRGDGRGGWTVLSASESGVDVDGEGRAVAVADFDQDGRPDLAVGQHRGPTRLYRNDQGRPGLRIRLSGPPGNPMALGARVRLVYRDGTRGPGREVRAGGGYASQDSAEVVLGRAQETEAVEVRWPGGATQRVAVPPGAGLIRLQAP